QQPPTPSRTPYDTSTAPRSENASRSTSRSRMWRGSTRQPSQLASSPPVQSVGSRPQRRSTIAAGSSRSGSDELPALRADPLEQLLERIGELLDAFLLERVGDVVVVDPGPGQLVEQASRLVEALVERRRDGAVVLERLDRLLRHRVDRVGADQRVDIERVR